MNTIASLTKQPRPVTIDGETYLVHPLEIADFGKLQAWIDAQYRNPLEVVSESLHFFQPPQQRYLLDKATEQASRPKPKIGTPEADELLRSVEGVKVLLRLSIAKGRPDFSEALADQLFDKFTPLQIQTLFQESQVEAVLSDPKAEITNGPETDT
jgi:hypothetical protein